MNNQKTINKWNAPVICFSIFAFILIVLFIQFCYLGLSSNVYGINMKEFASNRNTVSNVLTAERGTIYDFDSNVLAQNIISYTLIAYLDEKRTTDPLDPKHVVDKDYTATKLSKILGEDNYEYILERLNKKSKQVEFGSIGKNLTELTKLAIENLKLPGIDFTETVKRYYPNGDFASYIIGYAKQYTKINIKVGESYNLYDNYKNFFDNYENVNIEISDNEIINVNGTIIEAKELGKSLLFIRSNKSLLATIYINTVAREIVETTSDTIVGELGIESKFEEELQGTDGYIKYQQDKYGYQIPDTKEEKVEAINGKDIYLTIDSNIQRFAESAINDLEDYEAEWSIVSVMDAKTGAILASATDPSYNPNSLTSDMTYQNPLVSYAYEPGSVMKIYTYICALETGLYNGTKSYLSGGYEFSDGTIMSDWDKKGWGYLTYDQGFSYSSNTAIINIINDYLSAKKLRTCLENFGFGKKTGIELSSEAKGSIKFNYETEVMAAGFGQGISTTPIQQLQALTIIANNGVMVKPHIINKIVDGSTNEVTETQVVKTDKLVSDRTITKIKDLMESVISEESPTGKKYYLEGYDLIGKTGTAQIYENGKYLTGSNDYIVSIAMMYPKENPEIIIYAAIKKPNKAYNTVLTEPIKELVKNISKYKSIFSENETNNIELYNLDTYVNKDINDIKKELEENNLNVIVIGEGNKIIKQYPKKNTKVVSGDKIFLVTNSIKYKLTNMNSWSKNDAMTYCELTQISCNYNGNGYAVKQSISDGSIVNDKTKLDIYFELRKTE